MTAELFCLDHLKVAKGLEGPLNDFSSCYLTIAMCCVIHAEDNNKHAGT